MVLITPVMISPNSVHASVTVVSIVATTFMTVSVVVSLMVRLFFSSIIIKTNGWKLLARDLG